MGASLHQVQDWYSHWSEGYRWWSGGHVADSYDAGCTGSGPCKRPPDLIEKFYREHPRTEVRSILVGRYGGSNLSNISDDKLIDLYLYTYTEPRSDPRSDFGYDTDYFFGFTERDLTMSAETIYWILTFFSQLDPCRAAQLWLSYTPPSSDQVLDFLNTGSYRQ